MAHILCVGLNDAVMATRKAILERAGHTVSQAMDIRRILTVCESHPIRVAVLGSSLGANEKMRVSDAVHKECKAAKILELHTGVAPELPSAHGHLRMTETQPEGLIEAVNALLPKARKAKADSEL